VTARGRASGRHPRAARGALSAIGALALAALARPLHAAPDDAARLFDQGTAALDAGRFAEACPAIEQSYKLDPRPGTLFTLAQCEAKAGRLATAVRRYDDYLALHAALTPDKKKVQRDRESVAREQRAMLAPLVPELTLTLAPGAPAGTVVTRDGAPLGEGSLGVAAAVDSGDHVVTVRGPGAEPVELRVTLARGDEKALLLEPKPAPAPAPTAAPSPPPAPPAPPAPPPAPRSSAQRVAAVVVGSIGLAGVVVGAVTGRLALGKKSAVNAGCGLGGDAAACTHDGKAAADALKSLGLVSTIAFAVGGAGVGTGVVLWATAPKGAEHAGGLAWRGAF
jgi:hypothetical protein